MINTMCRRTSSFVSAIRCGVRHIPLMFRHRPGTPLRVLCIMAFDSLAESRHARQLSASTVQALCTLLDLGAWMNADLDGKPRRSADCQNALHELNSAGYKELVSDYLQGLRELETGRPRLLSQNIQFTEVRNYREAVVKLSLGVLAVVALGETPGHYSTKCLRDSVDAIDQDPDLNLLFRLAMQCQILDDLWDYSADLARRLPSFLTTTQSLRDALQSTAQTSRCYRIRSTRTGEAEERFSFTVALFGTSAVTSFVIKLAEWRCRLEQGVAKLGSSMAR